MIQRLINSLKFRLFFGYCRKLESVKKKRLTRLDWSWEFRSDLPPLLMVTMEKDIPLLLYSLRSMRQFTAKPPVIWLAGDSGSCVEKLKSVVSCKTEGLKIFHWKSFFDELQPIEKRFVEVWKESRPWGGYARKFAVTVAANRKSAILLSDADVLWKGDFISRLEQMLKSNPTILAGRDYGYSYDRDVADALRAGIFSAPPLNCGFLYYSRNILPAALDANLYALAEPFAKNASTHIEQTLIAHAFQKSGGRLFETTEVATTLSDNFSLKEKVTCLVRHYAGAKDLFWRDA